MMAEGKKWLQTGLKAREVADLAPVGLPAAEIAPVLLSHSIPYLGHQSADRRTYMSDHVPPCRPRRI